MRLNRFSVALLCVPFTMQVALAANESANETAAAFRNLMGHTTDDTAEKQSKNTSAKAKNIKPTEHASTHTKKQMPADTAAENPMKAAAAKTTAVKATAAKSLPAKKTAHRLEVSDADSTANSKSSQPVMTAEKKKTHLADAENTPHTKHDVAKPSADKLNAEKLTAEKAAHDKKTKEAPSRLAQKTTNTTDKKIDKPTEKTTAETTPKTNNSSAEEDIPPSPKAHAKPSLSASTKNSASDKKEVAPATPLKTVTQKSTTQNKKNGVETSTPTVIHFNKKVIQEYPNIENPSPTIAKSHPVETTLPSVANTAADDVISEQIQPHHNAQVEHATSTTNTTAQNTTAPNTATIGDKVHDVLVSLFNTVNPTNMPSASNDSSNNPPPEAPTSSANMGKPNTLMVKTTPLQTEIPLLATVLEDEPTVDHNLPNNTSEFTPQAKIALPTVADTTAPEAPTDIQVMASKLDQHPLTPQSNTDEAPLLASALKPNLQLPEMSVTAPSSVVTPSVPPEQTPVVTLKCGIAENAPIDPAFTLEEANISKQILTTNGKIIIPTRQTGATVGDGTLQTIADFLDATKLDRVISSLEPSSRNYPPKFANGHDHFVAEETLLKLIKIIKPYADGANPSFHVLLRAAKIHAMARNLDMGDEHQALSLRYINQALAIYPYSSEANYLYGTMIAESGGMRESFKFFDQAIRSRNYEAYIAKANAFLALEDSKSATECLDEYKSNVPDDPKLPSYSNSITSGKFNIWNH